ncbi:MAG: phosphatase PAP2 family protein, partial [Gemmatimonadaceae bacterium]|nr:phosphatase PAP2 family protein [Gemmatimonadaceae bacterium]
VVYSAPLTLFDVSLADWIHVHATPGGLRAFELVSLAGSPFALGALTIVVTVVLGLRRRELLLVGWWAAVVGASILNWTLKQVIQRPRPAYSSAFIADGSFSFPSGHAMVSLVAYGMLAYLVNVLLLATWRSRAVVSGAAAALILAIGTSRLYLGVHYFSDVVGGYAAGVVWLAACISGVEVARRQRDLRDSNVADGWRR